MICRKTSIVIFLVALQIIGSLTQAVPGPPFTKIGSGYYLIERSATLTWYGAAHLCRTKGAHLVSIETQNEWQTLSSYLLSQGVTTNQWFWTAANDIDTALQFSWISSGQPMNYTKWSSGQPDNMNGNERCVHLYQPWAGNDILMNDEACSKQLNYICEVDTSNKAIIPAAPFKKIGDNYYLIEPTLKLSWISAAHYCRTKGSYLVSFDTENEWRTLSTYLLGQGYSTNDWFWTAGNDIDTALKFFWLSTGQPINFTRWSSSQPDNMNGNERCVHLYKVGSDFLMNDELCTKKFGFVCKAEVLKTVTGCTANPVPAGGASANWCDPNLCYDSTAKHIRCLNPTYKFGPDCAVDAKNNYVNCDIIAAILKRHNNDRNDIAGGVKYPKFTPAARMATLQWDNDLADVAALNAMQCNNTHDRCRGTPGLGKYVGQNIALIWWEGPDKSIEDVTQGSMDSWFYEYVDTTMADINRLPTSGPMIGHFTQMMQDQATRIGCGITRSIKNGRTSQFIACNYSRPNFAFTPVYANDTRPATKCTTGVNPQYPNLCSVNEVY